MEMGSNIYALITFNVKNTKTLDENLYTSLENLSYFSRMFF